MKRTFLACLSVSILILYVSFINSLTINAEIETVSPDPAIYDNPVDDFFVTDNANSLLMPASLNDGNHPSWFWIERTSNPQNGTAANQGVPYAVFSYAANSGFLGYDGFTYRYNMTQEMPPYATAPANISILVIQADNAQNAGRSCGVGQPVNVTNGNMWLEQTDFALPGIGEPIEIDRFYNSIIQTTGLFGLGWSTKYDESLIIYPDNKMIRHNAPDGKASYFGRATTTTSFASFSPGLRGEIVKDSVDATYTLSFIDGRTHKFGTTGRLLWQKDRNGNQTTLNYNTSGILTGVTDAFGRTLAIVTGSNGRVSQISDALGVIANYEYIPSSNLLQTVTYNDGSKYKFEYDITTVPGKTFLKTVKDALDNILETHAYDPQGRATTSEKHGGVERYTLEFRQYDMTYGEFTRVTDALGRITKYFPKTVYGTDLIIRTEGECSCSGGSQAVTYTYDTSNSWLNLVKKTDALNRDTVYTYDGNRNITAVTDVLGIRSFTYNSLGEVLTATDRMGGVTTNTYSSAGNLLTTKDALNNTTTFAYTSLGQPATINDALNHTTTLTWDSQGRMSKITDANSKQTNFGYDARARVTSITNAKNETTVLTYDLKNRPKKVIYPDTNFTEFTYDIAGRRIAVADPLNHSTNFVYDSAYRLTSITDALNHSTAFGYDLMSNLTSQADALGNVTNLEYDDFNRLKKVKYPLPVSGGMRLEENYTYDLVGNTKTHVDTAGRTTTYDYDTANRLIKITDPLTQITQFEYNARSQMTKVKDALNQEYVFTYDPLGRNLTEMRAGTSMSFEYDSVGNRKKRTDHVGRVSQYTYDNLNRLTKIEYGTNPGEGGIAKQFAYDELSRLVSAINEAGTVAITYDNRNRLKTETDVFGHVVEYGYDAANRRTLLKFDGSNFATYSYDNTDRLTGITNSSDSTTMSFGYDIANRLVSRAYPNSVTTTYDYDGMSRLTRLKDVNTASTLFDRQYSYNSANQISQIVEPSLTKVFGYDNVNRLASVTGGAAESYVFDVVGNRTSSHLSSSYSYSPFNKLAATDTSNYSFDANGNTQSRSEGSNFWRYGFDYENQVTSVASRRQTVRYVYDALGRRVRRHLKGSKELTKYTYDGEDVILDDDAVSGITIYQNGPGIDNKLRQTTGSSTTYFLSDHLGSTNGLANSSGALTASNSYDSFGNSTNSSFPTRYQFTGREADSYTSLLYSRARFYDPKLGRFISEDPIGFRGGDINLYGYVRNQPLMFRDSRGLFPDGDVLNPHVLAPLGGALSSIAAAIAVAASSPAVVAGAGFAAGYAVGYFPGQALANWKGNPVVNGPWNPIGTPIPMLPPWSPTLPKPQRENCEPMPRAIPWTRSPSIPIPIDPPDDRNGCAEEISDCVVHCSTHAGQPRIGGSDFEDCMKVCVTERCGGDPTWKGYKDRPKKRRWKF